MRRRTMFLVSRSFAIRMLRIGFLKSEILLFPRSFVAALSGIGLKRTSVIQQAGSNGEGSGLRVLRV